jgi:hypothetical protein
VDAQRAALIQFAERENFEVVTEFTAVETGKGADALDRRPQLLAFASNLLARSSKNPAPPHATRRQFRADRRLH